ncbi:MAG: hypothetical protein KZQ83_18785 [gamma proteobacterium symbiont of Taylorina sp.]|nr:hypothetical protein [gamma proteobacterium symbiont of Taylorina sp.]
MKIFIIPFVLILLSGCMTNEKEICTNYGEDEFTQALKLKLNKINFSYKVNDDGFICIAESKHKEFKQIVDVVDRYYRGLATILTNKDDKEKIISWLKKDKISYHTQPSKMGIFLVIYSMTEEKANENQFKLDELLHNL